MDLSLTEKFAELARAYCKFIETHESLSLDQLITEALFHLSGLYHAALLLPEPVYEDTDDDVEEPVEEFPTLTREEMRAQLLADPAFHARQAEWARVRAIYERLNERFDPYHYYLMLYDPYKHTETIHGSLGDDLADIYHDLYGGLDSWNDGDRDDAVHDWQQAFTYHWGPHILHAIPALHFLKYQNFTYETEGQP